MDHSIECSKIAGIIAERLGVDVELAKRGAVLHDIGKAIDFVQEGSGDDLGAEICRKYGESPEVLNCIMAHHEDEEPDTVEAVIVKVADALSSARPGARKESVELYLKRLENLEKIAMEFDGVEKVFAIQAGREVRVLVRPEEVSDDSVFKLSQDIAERIEREMDYPGEVKVNLVREPEQLRLPTKSKMNILCLGDIVGQPGHAVLKKHLTDIQQEFDIDFSIANIENSASGFGFNDRLYHDFKAMNIDAFTTGNHVYAKREVIDKFDAYDRLTRPINLPKSHPGKGFAYLKKGGKKSRFLIY